MPFLMDQLVKWIFGDDACTLPHMSYLGIMVLFLAHLYEDLLIALVLYDEISLVEEHPSDWGFISSMDCILAYLVSHSWRTLFIYTPFSHGSIRLEFIYYGLV
jgi:hypothetical protein